MVALTVASAASRQITNLTTITNAGVYHLPASGTLELASIFGIFIGPSGADSSGRLYVSGAWTGSQIPTGPDNPGWDGGYSITPNSGRPMSSITLNLDQPVAAFGATFAQAKGFSGPAVLTAYTGLNATGTIVGSITTPAADEIAPFAAIWSDSASIQSVVIADAPGNTLGFWLQTYALLTTPYTNFSFYKVARLAQVVDGGGWSTQFSITNTDEYPVTVFLLFRDDNGQILDKFAFANGAQSLPPGTTYFGQTPGTSLPAQAGWAEVQSNSKKVSVTATLIFEPWKARGSYVAAPSGNNFLMPFDNTQGNVTAVGVANTNSSQSINISLLFTSETGLQSNTSLRLGPNEHTSFIVPTMNPSVNGLRGTIKFSAPIPDISLMGLQAGNNTFTTVPSFSSSPIVSPPYPGGLTQ